MMLSGTDIKQRLRAGSIRIVPPVQDENIRPAGIRVHLSANILIPKPSPKPIDLDGSSSPEFESATIGDDGWVLEPGKFILGATLEVIGADDRLMCLIDGRSTLARLGLMVHLGSVTFDHIQSAGRAVTLELFNAGPFALKLASGNPIAMISFVELTAPLLRTEYRQYQGQDGPLAPRLGFNPGTRE